LHSFKFVFFIFKFKKYKRDLSGAYELKGLKSPPRFFIKPTSDHVHSASHGQFHHVSKAIHWIGLIGHLSVSHFEEIGALVQRRRRYVCKRSINRPL
jgi:hypothetical protein